VGDEAGLEAAPSVVASIATTKARDGIPSRIAVLALAGLLSSSGGEHQAARITSALGENIRFDPRRVRIPLPPIGAQREYGETFRRLWDFARTLRAAHDLGIEAVRDMIDVTAATLGQTADQKEHASSVRAKS
jgi:hypothetical protein